MLPSNNDEQSANSSLLHDPNDNNGLNLGIMENQEDAELPQGFVDPKNSGDVEMENSEVDGLSMESDEEDLELNDTQEAAPKKGLGKIAKIGIGAGAVLVLLMGGLVGMQKMGAGAPKAQASKNKPAMPILEDAPRPAPAALEVPASPAPASSASGVPAVDPGVPHIAPVDSTVPTVPSLGPANPFDAPSGAVAPTVPVTPAPVAPVAPVNTNPSPVGSTSAGLPQVDPFAAQTTPPAVQPAPVIVPPAVVEPVQTAPVAKATEVIKEVARQPDTLAHENVEDAPKVKKPVKTRPSVVKKSSVVRSSPSSNAQQESHPSQDTLRPQNSENFYGYEKLF